MTISYCKRENMFEKGESAWRVEDDALVCVKPDGGTLRHVWREVTALRVRFRPTTAKPWLHEFTLETARGSVTVDNGHFAGLGNFEDRSASYTPFVRAAIGRVRTLAPQAQVQIGSPPVRYWTQLGFAAVSLFFVAVLILIFAPALWPLAVLVKLGVIAYGLLLLPKWIRRNRPRPGDFDTALAELPQ